MNLSITFHLLMLKHTYDIHLWFLFVCASVCLWVCLCVKYALGWVPVFNDINPWYLFWVCVCACLPICLYLSVCLECVFSMKEHYQWYLSMKLFLNYVCLFLCISLENFYIETCTLIFECLLTEIFLTFLCKTSIMKWTP